MFFYKRCESRRTRGFASAREEYGIPCTRLMTRRAGEAGWPTRWSSSFLMRPRCAKSSRGTRGEQRPATVRRRTTASRTGFAGAEPSARAARKNLERATQSRGGACGVRRELGRHKRCRVRRTENQPRKAALRNAPRRYRRDFSEPDFKNAEGERNGPRRAIPR